MMRYYFSFIILAMLTSCTKEKDNEIALELQPYIDQFVAEGMARGIDIGADAYAINARLELLETDGLKGQCQHSTEIPDLVLIDLEFWKSSSSASKEFILFHELGHCLLGRTHYDEVDQNGLCLSMMHSGSTRCRTSYTTQTRERFLDELFSY